MLHLIRPLALLAALLHLPACCSAYTDPGLRVDSIVVTYSPSGPLDADDVRTVEITDAETVELWVAALEAVGNFIFFITKVLSIDRTRSNFKTSSMCLSTSSLI